MHCAPLSCATFCLCTTTDVTAIGGSVLWVGLVEHICISDECTWHLECKLLLCKPSPVWREPEQQEDPAQRHHKEAWLCWERLHARGVPNPTCGTQPHQRGCDPFTLVLWNTDEMPERNNQKTEQKTVGFNSRLLELIGSSPAASQGSRNSRADRWLKHGFVTQPSGTFRVRSWALSPTPWANPFTLCSLPLLARSDSKLFLANCCSHWSQCRRGRALRLAAQKLPSCSSVCKYSAWQP